jgi:DNA-binding MurR/RpiR family transcriptional regulator
VFVVDYPERVQYMPITALAQQVGVSIGTVSRLSRSAECTGYAEFRRRLVQDLTRSDLRGIPSVRATTVALERAGAYADILAGVFDLSIQSLRETLQFLDAETFRQAIEVLAQAKLVYCFGAGGSGLVAIDASYRLLRIGVTALGEGDSQLQSARAALLTPHDVALAVSVSGEHAQTLDTAHAVKLAGTPLIVITNFPQSHLGRLADICLHTVSRQPDSNREAVPGRVVQLTLIDALCICLMRRSAPATNG